MRHLSVRKRSGGDEDFTCDFAIAEGPGTLLTCPATVTSVDGRRVLASCERSCDAIYIGPEEQDQAVDWAKLEISVHQGVDVPDFPINPDILLTWPELPITGMIHPDLTVLYENMLNAMKARGIRAALVAVRVGTEGATVPVTEVGIGYRDSGVPNECRAPLSTRGDPAARVTLQA